MKVAVLGAGAMGSALTIPLSDNGHIVSLWGTEYDTKILNTISKQSPHPRIGVWIPKTINILYANQLNKAVKDSDIVVIAVSSSAVGSITKKAAPYMKRGIVLVTVSKGLDERSEGIVPLTEVINSELPHVLKDKKPIVAVGGPSIARELARKLPTAAVYASNSIELAKICQRVFSTPYYRIKVSDDVVGIELCSALKNVYAIAVGWCDGIARQRGEKTMDNAKALLFTQAVEEMKIIVKVMGGKTETVEGLAGIGDFEVTCRGGRNKMFGEMLGYGLKSKEALEDMKKSGRGIVEGYSTSKKAYELANQFENKGEIRVNKDTPLLKEIFLVLFEDKPVKKALKDFLCVLC